jgi:crotonobetainyl-CoA:carnitine CoA-transferase CaiB-like acyl-CoA transferase
LTLAGRSHIITGLAMALYEREHTGRGQIIDFSVTDSISYIKQVADRSKLKIPDEFHRFKIT